MVNTKILAKYLQEYKQIFPERFKNESRYLWQSVFNFQNVYIQDSDNFYRMLGFALKYTGKLLVLRSNYHASNPKKMILWFAKDYPQEMSQAFKDLYDESVPLLTRLANFRSKTSELRLLWNQAEKNNFKFFVNYQSIYIIHTYLFLRYPQKYFIYQPSMVSCASDLLEGSYEFNNEQPDQNIITGIAFLNEIRDYLKKDEELLQIVKDSMNQYCHDDENLTILTSDFAYFLKTKHRELHPLPKIEPKRKPNNPLPKKKEAKPHSASKTPQSRNR